MNENNIPLSTIEFEADFAPFQPEYQKAVEGVKTFQFSQQHPKNILIPLVLLINTY